MGKLLILGVVYNMCVGVYGKPLHLPVNFAVKQKYSKKLSLKSKKLHVWGFSTLTPVRISFLGPPWVIQSCLYLATFTQLPTTAGCLHVSLSNWSASSSEQEVNIISFFSGIMLSSESICSPAKSLLVHHIQVLLSFYVLRSIMVI